MRKLQDNVASFSQKKPERANTSDRWSGQVEVANEKIWAKKLEEGY